MTHADQSIALIDTRSLRQLTQTLAALSVLVVSAWLSMGDCSEAKAAEKKQKPNIVLFLADDLGWGDLACYGHPRIKTPHLDAFAQEGLRMTQCYSACSVCSPSRSSILTGRTPYRNGVWRWIPSGSEVHLRSSEITIASLLQERGYDTCHVGKWHLNGHFNSDKQPQPNDHGYDHWLATQNNASPHHLNPVNFVRNGEPVGRMEGASSHVAVEEAIHWLQSRSNQGTPFFLTVWTHEPHLPIESASRFMQPYADLDDEGLRQHHGNITQLDAAFGKLMAALNETGKRDETFVMFTSDNGPEGNGNKGRTRGSTGGLRGRKRHTYEGGIRVPGIVRWPGHVQPGSESAQPVIGSDIFTTICDAMEIPLPADRTIDGASMLPLFESQSIKREQPLYWRNHLAPNQQKVALRSGPWKIIGSSDLTHFELYHIDNDPQETQELSAEHAEKFTALKEQLIAHDAAVLKEGPDWWQHEQRRNRKAKPLSQGNDQTDTFDVIKGGQAVKSDHGIELRASGECLALKKLDTPLTGSSTIRLRYRSTLQNSPIRNAALVLGTEPTNAETVKIGTAIGLAQHVAFQGDWNRLGSLARKNSKLEPLQWFEVVVTVDVPAGTVQATIDGEKLTAKLPADWKGINYLGYYVKNTASEFSAWEIE